MMRVSKGKHTRNRAKLFSILLATFIALSSTVTGQVRTTKKLTYPPARKSDVVTDYHGTKVPDPYRWLEDASSQETIEWVNAENELTRSYIDRIPERDKIEKRMTEIWNYPKYSVPRKRGTRYFFSKNDGLENQYVLYMQESLKGEARVVIDPNKLSEDGTIALTNQAYSKDGRLLAYGLSSSGSDWQEIRVRDVDTRKDYGEVLKWCKFSSIAWKHDKSGFYYNRFPEGGTVPPEDQNNFNRVYWHRLGTPQSEDVLVYERPAEKELGFDPFITDDGEYLCLYVYHGTDDRNGMLWRKVDSNDPFRVLMEVGEAEFTPIDNIGSRFYFQTDLDAPRGRVIAVDLEQPGRDNWREIIAEQADVLDFAAMVADHLVTAYMHDAHHVFKIYDLNGKYVKEINLPTIGAVRGLSGKREDTEMFFGFSSFLFPSTVYRYDFTSDELAVFRGSEIDFDPSGYVTKQVFSASRDGTLVPIFITHKKGLKLNGSNPTLLYGYGGFNISLKPYFSISVIPWLENGGIYAVACLRGGSEYGEEWHRAGMLGNKQNVFDDFIGAAEWLIKNGYTNPKRLAIMGASNGGLLVAACMLKRPDLFGAVVCGVPVTDMLRYHKFTVGRYWVPEYGNAEENPEHFKFLYAYSPLHNVRPGIKCPPTLVTTADTDDRVVPMHAKKFVAALQAADLGDNPIILRVETKAGHGGGKPTSKIIEELSDIYAFLFDTFGMKM